MRKTIASLAATFAVLAFSSAPASAHTTLVSMSPAADSIVTVAPTKVVLTFDENISPDGDGITVTAPDGSRIDVGKPVASKNQLGVDLGPISFNGHYLVNYRVVSSDGHPVEASVGFDVLIASLAPTTKAKIEVNKERENKIDVGEGRSGTENDWAIVLYVFFGVVLVGLFIFWSRRRYRKNKSVS